jgi:hypothetical protein
MSTSEKFKKMETEYTTLRTKLLKEYKVLKAEYEKTSNERDLYKEAIFEFKKYFSRFYINEDGDILYIEENVDN